MLKGILATPSDDGTQMTDGGGMSRFILFSGTGVKPVVQPHNYRHTDLLKLLGAACDKTVKIALALIECFSTVLMFRKVRCGMGRLDMD